MIASRIVKRMMRSSANKSFQGDVEAALSLFADDGVYDFPLDISAGGTVQGKKAMLDWFHRWYEQFPKRKLVVKNISFAA